MKSDIILSILEGQKEILYSWGFNNVVSLENGLQFNVQGFLFKGKVTIFFNQDDNTFTIILDGNEGGCQRQILGIHPNELINAIDSLVEKNCSQEEYAKKVVEEYEARQKTMS